MSPYYFRTRGQFFFCRLKMLSKVMFIIPSVCDLVLVYMPLGRIFKFVCYKFSLTLPGSSNFEPYVCRVLKVSLYFYHKTIPKFIT